jgi:DNA topoisomerase-1
MPPKYYRKKKETKTYETNDYYSNAMYLIIVESPSKCKKIEGFLGSQYKCIASKGHIRTIKNLKSIKTKKNYETEYTIIDEKLEHVEFMQKIINRFSKHNIILATDDDREGEGIAWHICDIFNLPVETTQRIIFHEITKDAVLYAVKHPTVININLVYAQQARQILDVIVGFKISPFLWKHIYNDKSNGLSAGRCQTPALRLVYENEKTNKEEIETKYKTTGNFFTKNITFHLNRDFETSEQVSKFLEKSIDFKHEFTLGSPKEVKKSPPKPFNTSRLLQAVSNTLHYSPKETMSLCQMLYQDGHITYMRTENTKYAGEFLKKAQTYILEKWEDPKYIGNIDDLENKDESNPHEAIRVTHIEDHFIPGLEGKLSSLYKFIWKNTIESCMSDAKYNCITANITAPDKHHYSHVVEIPIFLGWKKASEKAQSETEDQNTGSGLLLFFQSILKSGSRIIYNNIESVVTIQNKHSHYTEASLIQKLEDLGIGRPSTFAMIVDTIQERGYVKKVDIPGKKVICSEFVLRGKQIENIQKEKVFGNEKNKLVIQSVGVLVLEFLLEHFSTMFSYDYTKRMEDDLDKISNGQSPTAPGSGGDQNSWYMVCKKCDDEIKILAKSLTNIGKQSYTISDGYDLIFHQYGASLKRVLDDGQVEYKPVKKDIQLDLEKLRNGEYSLDDLIELKNDYLGKYENEDMFMKIGKYGAYVQWGDKKESVKTIDRPIGEITLEDVVDMLKRRVIVEKHGEMVRLPPEPPNKNILRILSSDISIRKGKFGPYIFYMPAGAKKPEFFNIGKYKTSYVDCDPAVLLKWIFDTYKDKMIIE